MGYVMVILGGALCLLSIALLVGMWWLRSEPEYMRCRACGYNLDNVYRRSRSCPECGGRRRGLDGLTRGEANCGRVLALLLATASGFVGYKAFTAPSADALIAGWLNPVSVRLMPDREVLRGALGEWPHVSNLHPQPSQQRPYQTEFARRLQNRAFSPGTTDPFIDMLVEELAASYARRDPGVMAVSREVSSRMLLARQNGEIDAGQFGRVLATGAELVIELTAETPFDGDGMLERRWSYELGMVCVHSDPRWRCWLRGGSMTWEAVDRFPYRGDLLRYDESPIDGASRPNTPIELFGFPTFAHGGTAVDLYEGGSGEIVLTDGAYYRISNDLVFEFYEPSDMGPTAPYPGAKPVAVFIVPENVGLRLYNTGSMGFPFGLER